MTTDGRRGGPPRWHTDPGNHRESHRAEPSIALIHASEVPAIHDEGALEWRELGSLVREDLTSAEAVGSPTNYGRGWKPCTGDPATKLLSVPLGKRGKTSATTWTSSNTLGANQFDGRRQRQDIGSILQEHHCSFLASRLGRIC